MASVGQGQRVPRFRRSFGATRGHEPVRPRQRAPIAEEHDINPRAVPPRQAEQPQWPQASESTMAEALERARPFGRHDAAPASAMLGYDWIAALVQVGWGLFLLTREDDGL